MQNFKVYYQRPNEPETAGQAPNVQADSEPVAAFIAATRWLTAALNRGQEIPGVVIVLDDNKARVLLSEGEVLDFYAELA